MRDMRALVHRLAERRADRAALLAPDGRGRGPLRPRRDRHPRRASSTRAALDELIATTAGPLRAAHDRRRARRRRSPAARRASSDVDDRERGLTFAAPTSARSPRSSLELAQAGIGLQRARAAHGDARGAVLPHDRGRRREPRRLPGRPPRRWPHERRRRPARPPPPGVGTVYAWELRKLRAQKRTYIGLGCALLVPLIFIVALLAEQRRPRGHPVRALRARVRPGDPARRRCSSARSGSSR